MEAARPSVYTGKGPRGTSSSDDEQCLAPRPKVNKTEIETCWIDLMTSAACCPALHEAPGGYIVQGPPVDNEVRANLSYIDDHEVAVSAPRSLLDLLVLNEKARVELTFANESDWAKRYERIASLYMVAWADELLRDLSVRDSMTVVDLACGTGFVSRRVPILAPSTGTLISIDRDPAMAFEAIRQAPTADVRCALAEDTGLESSSVDLLLCQQGLQYFTDPSLALKETMRVLKPGGQFRASIWAGPHENPFLASHVECVRRYLKRGTVDDIMARNVDGMGGPSEIAAMFSTTGFEHIVVGWQEMRLAIPSFSQYFCTLVENSTWGELFKQELPQNRQAEVEAALQRGVDWRDGVPVAVMKSLILDCRKPE